MNASDMDSAITLSIADACDAQPALDALDALARDCGVDEAVQARLGLAAAGICRWLVDAGGGALALVPPVLAAPGSTAVGTAQPEQLHLHGRTFATARPHATPAPAQPARGTDPRIRSAADVATALASLLAGSAGEDRTSTYIRAGTCDGGETISVSVAAPPGRPCSPTAPTPSPAPAGDARRYRERLSLLDAWLDRQDALARIGRELEDTNRGVVALYAELDDQADRLRRADEAKGRFLSNVSHELRTPLNSIRALARLLLDRTDGPLGDEQDKQVRFIRKAADDLLEMVDDLLDLAKIDAGRTEVRIVDVRLEDLWSALRGAMRPLACVPEVELVFEPPPALRLATDEGKLAQILRNLLSNALKYTERGTVRLRARQADGQLELAVIDTGIGIDPSQLSLIFEEFVQVDSPLQRRVKGTGLGLPLCRRLATLIGARLQVESRPGAGSTFRLLLPLPPTAAARGSA